MNRFAFRIVSGAAIALSTACSAPSDKVDPAAAGGAAAGLLAEPTIADIRGAIEAANQKWLAGMLAGDADGVIANYADDAMVMMPMTPTWSGRTAIELGMREMLAVTKVSEAKGTTLDVVADGDLAVETGTFTFTTTMKGAKPVTEHGRYLTVWKRQVDGSWKIFRDISNNGGAPRAPLTSK